MAQLTLTEARIAGQDRPTTVVLSDGVIADAGERAAVAGEVIDLGGRWLLPGLWDHHVHLTQWARTRSRLDVSAADSAAAVAAQVRAVGTDGLLVAFGFRWATWAVAPSLALLDAARPAPTVVLSGDLHTSWVNTAAARMLGVSPGVLREDAAFAVQRVLDAAPLTRTQVDDAVRAAHSRGVVGVVDLEMADNAAVWAERHAVGIAPLRVEAGFYRELLEARISAGVRSGAPVPGTRGLVTHGPLKIITDGSLNTLTAHCLDPYPGGGTGVQNVSPAELTGLLARAAAAGIRVAVHAIGDRANSIALDAIAAAGATGSIEHAQLVSTSDLGRFAALRVTASVQPEHALDDRDAADVLWPGRTDRAFPLRSLLDAGARLAFGSDAPVAPLDPWLAISAAVGRTRDGRTPWHPEQAVTQAEALAASVRHGIVPGSPADLVAVDLDPLTAGPAALRTMPVAATVVAGAVVHDAR